MAGQGGCRIVGSGAKHWRDKSNKREALLAKRRCEGLVLFARKAHPERRLARIRGQSAVPLASGLSVQPHRSHFR